MSLYIGHLSPRVQREELERVFRKFGRCTVQLKDGYGFVVYEITADAEKALRALRGRNICGEQISLNWSNRQPRPFHRSARASRFYEPRQGRSFKNEDDGAQIRGFHDRRDLTRISSVHTHDSGGHNLDDVLEKEAGHISVNADDIRTIKGISLKEGGTDEGVSSEHNLLENDRWGEPAGDAFIGHEQGNSYEFDRYEPYHGYRRREERENNHMGSPYGSRGEGISPEKGRRGLSFDEIERNIDRSRPQLSCYNCGLVGHVMRNCPHGDPRQDKFSSFNHRRNERSFRDRGEGRVKRTGSNSRGRPHSTEDALVLKRHMLDRKGHHTRKARRVRRHSSETYPESREMIQVKHREGLQAKKKRKIENGTPKKILKKRRVRRPGTSSTSSATSSQSHSKSLGSTSDSSSYSRSRSPSSRSHSRLSGSKSASKSYSKFLSSRSKSRSRSKSGSSFPRSPSLSVSLEQRQRSSMEKVNIPTNVSSEDNLDYLPSPESKHHFENSEPVASSSVLKYGNKFTRFVDSEPDGDHPGIDGDDAIFSVHDVGDKGQSSRSDVGNQKVLKYGNKFTRFEADSEPDGDHPGIDGDGAIFSAHKVGDKGQSSHSDVGNHNDVTSEDLRENGGLNGFTNVKPKVQVPVRCGGRYSAGMSTQEILGALRHYGLPTPEESKSDIPIEKYFGAARLWPWEIIYHRRLSKGPISKDNYDRRLEQNREFGIVDKYIRSSSGWGECDQIDS